MVNFRQLQQLDISALERFADHWLEIHKKIEDSKSTFEDNVTRPLKDGTWKGAAGQRATRYCDYVERDIEDVATEVAALRSFIDDAVDGSGEIASLKGSQQRVQDLHRQALEKGMTVNAEGGVQWSVIRAPGPLSDEEKRRYEQKDRDARELERQIKEELRVATEADQDLAKGLKVVFGTTHNFETEDRAYGDHDNTVFDDLIDEGTKKKLEVVEFGLRHVKGWNNAADMLRHYLDASGQPVNVDPQKMLNEIPNFQRDANKTLNEIRSRPDGTFTTDWTSTAPNTKDGNSSLDWYYALNHFQYRMVGEKKNGTITYHIEVQKRYDWGIPSEHRSNLNEGPIQLEQADIAHLNSVGKAKDFDVRGTSGKMTAPA